MGVIEVIEQIKTSIKKGIYKCKYIKGGDESVNYLHAIKGKRREEQTECKQHLR
jgi:hypothetical protein